MAFSFTDMLKKSMDVNNKSKKLQATLVTPKQSKVTPNKPAPVLESKNVTPLKQSSQQVDYRPTPKSLVDSRYTPPKEAAQVGDIRTPQSGPLGPTFLSPAPLSAEDQFKTQILEKQGYKVTPSLLKSITLKETPEGDYGPTLLSQNKNSAKQTLEDSERWKEYKKKYDSLYSKSVRFLKENVDVLEAGASGIISGGEGALKRIGPTIDRMLLENLNVDPYGELDLFDRKSISGLDQAREEYGIMHGNTEDVYYNATLEKNKILSPIYHYAMDSIDDSFEKQEAWAKFATEGKSDLVKESYRIAESSSSFVVTLAATAITKNPELLAVLGTMMDSGNTYNEARKTSSPSGAFNYFAADAAITFGLENVGWKVMMGKYSKPLATRISSKMPFFGKISKAIPVASTIVVETAETTISEGYTEFLQTLGQNLVAHFGYDKTRGIFDGAIEAMLLGGILGGGSTAIHGAIQSKIEKGEIKKLKEEMKDNPLLREMVEYATGEMAKERASKIIKDGLNTTEEEAQKVSEYLYIETKKGAEEFQNNLNTSFKENRTIGLKGMEDAGKRVGIDIPGALPVPKDVIDKIAIDPSPIYTPARVPKNKNTYGNDKFIEGQYDGQRITTNGVIMEFNSTVQPSKNAIVMEKKASEDKLKNIDAIIPKGDMTKIDIKASFTNNPNQNIKEEHTVWLGTPNTSLNDGRILNKKYYDYLVNKYPEVTFKQSDNPDVQPVAVFSKDKLVAIVMPLDMTNERASIGPDSTFLWKSQGLTGHSNPSTVETTITNNQDESTKSQIPSTSGVSGSESGRIPRDNRQSTETGQRAKRTRGGILGTNRERSGTSKATLNEKAKELLNSKDTFTDSEKDILRAYAGLGGAGEGGRGSLDEYYTPKKVVSKMWALAKKHGFTGGNVLEPSAGVGVFVDMGPKNANYDAFEIDDVSSKIAKIVLEGKGKVQQKPFENLFMDETGKKVEQTKQYDLIIGNPPYGEHRGYYKGLGEESKISKYEEYFIKRSLDIANENGLVVMIIPSNFLKNQTGYAKKQISMSGELVEAYRLPEKMFKDTAIGTDILVFKKNTTADTEVINSRMELLSTNKYFQENTKNVLGTELERKGRFGKMETYVTGNEDVLDNINVDETQDNDTKVFKEVVGPNVERPVVVEVVKEIVPKKKAKAEIYNALENTGQMFTTMNLTDGDKNIWRAKNADGTINTRDLIGSEIDILNVFEGKYYDDFDYLQGNIYEKLDALAKEDITAEKKQEQMEKLNKILPAPKKIKDIYINPIGKFALNFKDPSFQKSGYNYGQNDTVNTMAEDYMFFLRDLPENAFAPSSMWETLGYIRNDSVRTRGDKALANTIKDRRKKVAEKLFPEYLKTLNEDVIKKIEEDFNKTKNGYVEPDYTKVPIFIDGLDMDFGGKGLKMGEYKIDSIGFLSNRGTGINANGVGLGKTMMSIISTAQDVQKGWYKRPLFIVPKGVYKKWISEIQMLFPKQKVVGLGNLGAKFGIKNSADIQDKIKDGDFTIMTFEAISQIGFNEETQKKLLGEIDNAYTAPTSINSSLPTERQWAKDKEKINEIAGKAKIKAGIWIEDLGFDNLIIDEAHNFKNIFSRAKESDDPDVKSVKGRWNNIEGSSSQRGLKMWLMSQYVQENNNGRGVKMLTATPFTNNPLEFYNMLSLVAMKDMKAMGIGNINDFMDTFLKTTKKYIVKSGGKYELADVVENWQNKEVLSGLIKRYVDFKDGEDYGVQRPNKIVKDNRFNATDKQLDYLKQAQVLLSPKYAQMGGVLSFIDEAKKITLSPYLSRYSDVDIENVSATEFIESSPKLMGMMSMIKANDKKTGQVIFLPIGVGQSGKIRDYLINTLKYKSSEVGIIHGGITDTMREKIKGEFNDGKIKVVIGSDAIKEGVDLQGKSTDLYVTSYPWRPTDLIQVEGRIHRQGNKYKNVRINYLSLNDSVDAFLFQKMDTKTKRLVAADAVAQQLNTDDLDYEGMTSELITDPIFKLEVEEITKTNRLEEKINSTKSEIALLERENKTIDKLQKEKTYYEEQATEWKSKGDDRYINANKEVAKNNKKLKTFEAKKISIESNSIRITSLKEALAVQEEKLKTIGEYFKEKKSKTPTLAETPRQENNFKKIEDRLREENKTFIITTEQDKKNQAKAAKASSAVEKVLPSTVISKKSAIEPLNGPAEPSGDNSLTSLPESLENISETSNTLSSQRTKFLSEWDINKGLLTDSILEDFTNFVNTNIPEYDSIVKDLTQRTNSEAFYYRTKPKQSIIDKLTRKPKKILGTIDDGIGGTIVTDDLDNVIAEFRKDNPKEKSVEDFRKNPTLWGYDGVHFEKELSTGLYVEIQVHTREKLYQKEYAHTIYAEYREYFEDNTSDYSKEALLVKMGPEVYAKFEVAIKLSRDLYAGKVPVPQEYIDNIDEIIEKNKLKLIEEPVQIETQKTVLEEKQTIAKNIADNEINAYHGTGNGEFDIFDNSKIGTGVDSQLTGRGDFGEGHYFTTNIDDAKSYAENSGGAKPTVIEVKLENQKPADFRKITEYDKTFRDELKARGENILNNDGEASRIAFEKTGITEAEYDVLVDLNKKSQEEYFTKNIQEELANKGFDSLISQNGEIVIFDPTLIKTRKQLEKTYTEPEDGKTITGSIQTDEGIKDVTVTDVTPELKQIKVGNTEKVVNAKTKKEVEARIKEIVSEMSAIGIIEENTVVEIEDPITEEPIQGTVIVSSPEGSVVEVDGGFQIVENTKIKEITPSDEAVKSEEPPKPPVKPKGPRKKQPKSDEPKIDLNLNKFERFRIVVQDQALGLEKAQKIVGNGQNVSEDMDMYMEFELHAGAQTAAIEKFEKETWNPLQKEYVEFTSQHPKNTSLIQDYLHFSHAPERNANHYDGAAGITTEEAKAKLKIIEAMPQYQDMKIVADKFRSLAKKMPKFLYENGMIKKEEYDSYETLYEYYAPLQRIMPDNNDMSQALGIGKGFDTRGTEIKRARGSELEVDNIVESIRINWERSIVRVQKNNVGKVVLEFAKNNTNMSLFEVVKGKMNLMEVDGEIIRYMSAPHGENILTVKVEGKEKYIKINDKTVAYALKNMGAHEMNAALRAANSFTRFYSMINTSLNPEFIISNAIKDIQTAALNTTKDFGVFGVARNAKLFPAAYKGVFDSLRGKDTEMAKLYDQLKTLGGTTGYFNLSSREQIGELIRDAENFSTIGAVKKLKYGGKQILKGIDFMNDVVENGTRLAVFKIALDKGLSPKKSAQLAKNATVNFNKHGTAGPAFNALYAFSNASVQGSTNVLRTLSNPKSLAKITTLISIISTFLQAFNRGVDEEGYENIPSYVRESNWIIMVDRYHYVKIGLPWGYNVIKVMADNTYELSIGKTVATDSLKSVMGAFINAYDPIGGANLFETPIPTFLRPAYQAYTDKGWYEGNISPMNFTGIKASLNYNENENPIFVSLANFMSKISGGTYSKDGIIEMTPAQIEYLWNQYSGGVGRFIMGGSKTIVDLAEGNPIKTGDIPFWRKVVGEVDPQKANNSIIYDTIDLSKERILNEEEKAKVLKAIKEEGANKNITFTDAEKFIKTIKSSQDDLKQVDKTIKYIESQNWSDEKTNAFLEKLGDKNFTKEKGLGSYTKTQIKQIRSEL